MRIGVFPAIVGRQGGGVETYEMALLREMTRLDTESDWFIYCLGQSAVDALQINQRHVQFEVLKPSARWISIPFSLPRAIKRSGVDLVHSTFVPPIRCPVPLVATVHDVCIHTHPHLYPRTIRWRLNYLLYQRLHRFDHVICPTLVSRDLIIQHFRVREDRITVIPDAVDGQFQPVTGSALQEVLDNYRIDRRYFLFAGNLRVGNKNLVRLLHAYALFKRQHGDEIALVLTGRRSWQSKLLDETIDELNLRSSIIETGWLKPEHVPALYSGAIGLLFPSLCEGFGLPALEAMACGTPVITSNTSCLPEVVGEAAILVDPYQPAAIAEGMRALVDTPGLHEQLRQNGFRWVAQFSWKRTALETRAVYDKVLGI